MMLRRSWTWLLVAALVVVALGAWRSGRDSGPVAVVAAAEFAAPAAWPDAAGPEPAPGISHREDSGAAPAARSRLLVQAAAPVWDLCGVGRLPRPAGTDPAPTDPLDLPRHLGADPLATAMGRLLERLDAGGPRQRAAAMMLRGSDAAGVEAGPALAQLLMSSPDPVVASWTMMRCAGPSHCSEAVLQRWSELEPDNLAAWLAMAQHQPDRRAEAVRRAPATARFETYQGKLLEVVLQAMPADVPPYVQMQVWIQALGIESATALPSPGPLLDSCRPEPQIGSPRQRDCAAMARVMLEHSDSAMGRLIGLKLAERSGSPAAAVKARHEQLKSMLAAPQSLFDEQQPLSCASHERVHQWLQWRAQRGEMGALQAMADEAGPAASLRR